MLGCSLLLDTRDLSSTRDANAEDAAAAPSAAATADGSGEASNDGGDGATDALQPQPSRYREVVLASGPIGYWRMGQPNGSRIADETGRGNDLVLAGATTVVPGAIASDPDTAIAFDGETGMATAVDGTPFTFTGTQAFSVELWMKRPATYANQYEQLCGSSNGLGSSRVGWLLYTERGSASDSPGYLVFQWRPPDGQFNVVRAAPPADTFTHVVATFDGQSSQTWVDGVESGAPRPTSGELPSRPPRFSVGGDPQGSAGAAFSGAIDELAVYDRVLTRDEILRHFSVGRGM